MTKISLLSLVLAITIASCSKNVQESSKPKVAEDIYKDEFVACDCADAGVEGGLSEYLKAEINGVSICADVKGNFGDPSFGNMLTHGKIMRDTGAQYYDNLYMIRYTRDNRFMMGIFLENTHALTKQYPYELPRPNSEYCEIGELQLENQSRITNEMCAWCSWNDWHYWAPFFASDLKLIVDRYENGYFEGRFSGRMQTGSGRFAKVKNGTFRIRLTEQEKDIVVP